MPHYLRTTTAVGIYPQGRQAELNLYDMSGNVWEWCLNEYEHPERTQIAGEARRVLRGGSWNNPQDNARAASRVYSNPNGRYGFSGFRVVVGCPI